MSSSTQSLIPQLVVGAKSFVTRLQVEQGLAVPISIELFAGGAPTVWQAPTLDTAKLLARLDSLSTYVPTDPASTNLYGSLITGLHRVRDARQRTALAITVARSRRAMCCSSRTARTPQVSPPKHR